MIRQDVILEAATGKRVLDIGCVAADRLMDLHLGIRKAARECIGLDVVEADGVVQGDAQNFDFDEPFDLVVAGEVIEHLGNVRGFLDSVYRNLKPGGRLILTTPNAYSFLFLRKAVFGKTIPNDPFHVFMFDSTTIQNMFRNFAPDRFSGSLFFYEDRQPEAFLYRVNKIISRFVPGFSSGIFMDLVRKQ